MAKVKFQPNPKVKQIFEDLEIYKAFCVEYGYVFDEASLYDNKSFAYRQHTRQLSGKEAKNFWDEDRVE